MSPLSKITNLETTSQFKLAKFSKSSGVNDLLILNTIRVNLFDNLLTFPDKGKIFEIKGDLFKMTTLIKTIMLILLIYRIKKNV